MFCLNNIDLKNNHKMTISRVQGTKTLNLKPFLNLRLTIFAIAFYIYIFFFFWGGGGGEGKKGGGGFLFFIITRNILVIPMQNRFILYSFS